MVNVFIAQLFPKKKGKKKEKKREKKRGEKNEKQDVFSYAPATMDVLIAAIPLKKSMKAFLK